MIPVWPEVEDRRLIAGVVRIVQYIFWWIFIIRGIAAYIIVLTSTVGLAYHFKNLCKYFEDLNEIFEGSGSQEGKERRYEAAFKVGIKMHSKTLWCTRQLQLAGGPAFSGQVLVTVSGLVILMMQMMVCGVVFVIYSFCFCQHASDASDEVLRPAGKLSSTWPLALLCRVVSVIFSASIISAERTLVTVMPIFSMAASVLFATGMLLWNAGDITIEASKLPAAVFHSGWHNCTKQSSFRVRKLVTIAITQAQKRVVIKGFGLIEMSYESYVTIVKSSYSVFSVMY